MITLLYRIIPILPLEHVLAVARFWEVYTVVSVTLEGRS